MDNALSIYLYILFFINIFTGFFYFFVFIKLKFKPVEKENFVSRPITFVIPAYNAQKTIENTISSIYNSNYPKEKIRILVVNDGSTDNTLKILTKTKELYPLLKILNKNNSGKADSLNYGLRLAKTEFVAVLDSDTIIEKDLLKKAIILFNNENIYAVTARFVPLKTVNFLERMQKVEYAFTSFFRKLMTHINSLPAAPAFTIFKRDFFVKHGYFDKDNITEDFEMGLRIQKNNFNIGYVLDSYATTEVPSNFKSLYKQRLRWYYGGLYNHIKYKGLFFNKNYGDLSFFVVPSGLAIILISAVSFIFTIYNLIKYSIKYITLYSNGWLPNFNFNFNNLLMTLTELKFLLIFSSLIMGLCFYLFVKNETEENLSIINYLEMIFIYLPLQSFFCFIAAAYYLLGIKPSW